MLGTSISHYLCSAAIYMAPKLSHLSPPNKYIFLFVPRLFKIYIYTLIDVSFTYTSLYPIFLF